MQTIEIHGKNAFPTFAKTRIACRGFCIRQDQLLLSYETKTDLWVSPGGGLEEGESLESCCTREIEEETGYCIQADECFLEMQEYYEEWRYITYYFSCHVVGQGQRRPTPREIRVGLEPRWLDMQAAQKIFATHESFDQIDEEKRGIYQRENLALQAFLTAKESRSP